MNAKTKEETFGLRAGIDIGGTTATIAVVSPSGNILDRETLYTGDYRSAADFVDAASTALEDMTSRIAGRLSPGEELEVKVAGIGIGAPCANTVTGEIEAATDLPWPSPIPLKALFEARTGLPVRIANDANAAAAGEGRYGAAKGMRNYIVITLGTGVGAGVVCDGHLLNGRSGFAAELGHVTLYRDSDRHCGCGRNGCLQNYCSASGVVETARRLLAADPETKSSLRGMDNLTSKDICLAAESGDRLAAEVWRLTGEALGYACAQYAAFSDPEAIILFGGVARAGALLTAPTLEAFDRHALHLYRGRVKILTTGLPGADAALLGAAALAE